MFTTLEAEEGTYMPLSKGSGPFDGKPCKTTWKKCKFSNTTKLCRVVNALEGRDAIQRDSERWAHANLLKFNKAKCKVLHVAQGNPKHGCRLGREWIDSSLEEKGLEVVVNEKKLNISQQRAQKANYILGCI
ncbi:rna-directed dna polymerase from mobile element jockey-like [Limosa lapponica baueri]|uniref:Rna-directed dna polymerase from mobile element jockey-like n=1 Tax=Limosa lapponica baueri TaxID=1758121 RepID=A0A2I0URG5_LIMLA|nr:rna-directed dna polymerase from mobile element jockey-like [Limosa lapponica baueri]